MTDASTHIHGDKLGQSHDFELLTFGTKLGSQAVGVTITVSAEGATVANQRDITMQFTKADGTDCDAVVFFKIHMFADAAGAAFVTTGGSTGVAAGTDGALLATVAKKSFLATSESDGDFDCIYTDTGTESVFMAVELPNGRLVFADELTNA